MFAKLGDFLSMEDEERNTIPLLAIIYASVTSLNSVGASLYQERLFKGSIKGHIVKYVDGRPNP